MRYIVETSSMRYISKKDVLENDIYNKLLAISKTHYILNYESAWYSGSDPSFQVQTFYGTFNLYPMIYGITKRRVYGDLQVSPFNIGDVPIATNLIRKYVKYIHSATELSNRKEDPFMRYDKSSYFTQFLNFINLPKILNFVDSYKYSICTGVMILFWITQRRRI